MMMNKTEIISLLKLLEDPDENVYQVIKDKIIDNKEMFKIYLENYHSLSIDHLALERSESILDEIFFYEFRNELIKYLDDPDSDLLQGSLLLETYFNREVDINQLKDNCREIIQSVWLEFNEQLTVIEKVKIINRILFRVYNFKKYPVGEFRQEYLSFTNCISYRKYISPTIALLYCIIAEQTKVPLYSLDIPGIFLLGYLNKEVSKAIGNENSNGIVFYLHPYDEGELVNHKVIEKYLKMQRLHESLDDIEIRSYKDFLFYLFELRIMVLKQSDKDSFEVKYSDEVLKLYNRKRNIL